MSVTVSTMEHSYQLVEEWLGLEHWESYGVSSRDYQIRHGQPVGIGSALWIGSDGPLRISRSTDLVPGVPAVLTYQMYCWETGRGACSLQVRDGARFQNILGGNYSMFHQGWNNVIVRFTPPMEWQNVELALYAASTDGGLIGPMRAMPAGLGE